MGPFTVYLAIAVWCIYRVQTNVVFKQIKCGSLGVTCDKKNIYIDGVIDVIRGEYFSVRLPLGGGGEGQKYD